MRTAWLLTLLGVTTMSLSYGGEVVLHRSDPSNVQARAVPVTVGVPFAVGQLTDEKAVALFDAGGKAVPCQTAVTSRWWGRGGSVQTLLVSFLADTAQERYVLRYGAGVSAGPLPTPAVTAKTDGDAVVVNAGVLHARLGGGFIQQLAYDANGDGKFTADETVVDSGKPAVLRCGEFSSAFGKPERVEIEEAGPIRAVVRIAGHHQSPAGQKSIAYDVRLTFYAGLALIRLDHTFLQDTDQVFADLPFVSLDLPLAMGKASVTFGLDAGKEATVQAADGRVGLLQVGPGQKESIAGTNSEEFRRILEERKKWWSPDEEARWTKGPEITEWATTLADSTGKRKVGERAAGWMLVTPEGKPWALTAGVRYFWQLHPKAFALDRGVLRIFAYPDDLGRPLHLHVGTAKTHTIVLALHPTTTPLHPPRRIPWLTTSYFPSPQWYCDSGVWGQVLPRKEGQFSLYETEASRTIRSDFVERPERSNGYGMLNFGDIAWGGNKWGNLETAYDHGMAVQFIRTGDREVFDCFERAVWHFRDVDVQQAKVPGAWDWGLWLIPGYMPEKLAQECDKDAALREKIFYWTGTQPPELGGVHRHSYMHFANAADNPAPSTTSYPEKRLRMYSGSCDVGGHGWIVGLVDHYLLTGDRRSLEVAELAGQWVLKRGGTGWGRDNWKNIDLAWLYRATGKQEYLQRLMEAIDVIYNDRESTVERIAAQDKTLMSPFYTILQFFKHVHQMTDDPGVRQKFLDLVTRWIDHVPTADSHIGPVFQYVRDYRDSRCHTDFADLAYAYLLTGDRKYLDKSLNTFDFYLHFAYHSTAFFSVPEYLYALDKAGLSALTDPAPSVRAGKAFWADETDKPVKLVVYQQSGYRVAAGETTGAIEVTSPSGKVTSTKIDRGGLDVYRLTIPPDGEKGTYKVEAKATGCYFWLAADVPLL
ncbi:MAG: hypothetical protein FJ279_06835, partial [Planctomycetes bacterium]|nr:hypothetical protein [Planctomycetota bacterium]